jgi:hypothetical protein
MCECEYPQYRCECLSRCKTRCRTDTRGGKRSAARGRWGKRQDRGQRRRQEAQGTTPPHLVELRAPEMTTEAQRSVGELGSRSRIGTWITDGRFSGVSLCSRVHKMCESLLAYALRKRCVSEGQPLLAETRVGSRKRRADVASGHANLDGWNSALVRDLHARVPPDPGGALEASRSGVVRPGADFRGVSRPRAPCGQRRGHGCRSSRQTAQYREECGAVRRQWSPGLP